MADAFDYLSPDFDLSSLTVPRLRAILVNHDVPYPASAKKAQLIGILQDEVLPQAKKLLRERERVKRTSDGITDAAGGSRASSVASSVSDYDRQEERDSMPPPPTPSTVSSSRAGVRRGRSTRSSRASTAEYEDYHAPTTPVATSSSRRSVPRSESKSQHRTSREHQQHYDGGATPVAKDYSAANATPRQSTVKKSRRTTEMMTPSTEPEFPVSAQPYIKPEPKNDNVFSADNPFQRGSPPSLEQYQHQQQHQHQRLRSVGRDEKRRSRSRVSESPAAFADGFRARKSETPAAGIKREYDDAVASARSPLKFQPPPPPPVETYKEDFDEDVYNDNDESGYADAGAGAGEEFTPEEQLSMEREQADSMYPAPAQPRSRRQPRKQGKIGKAAPWVVIFSLFGGFAGWWRREKIEIGFCGIGKPTWSLAETKVPDWAGVLEPQCEPCPPHAFCYPDFDARCEHDFILTPHPLSFGGLIPLPPTCEPDSEKARRVKAVADKTVEELRDHRAKWECGELTDDGRAPKSPEITEPDLKQEIGNKRRKGMSDAEFDDLWKAALGDVAGKDEIVSENDPASGVLTFSSTAVTRLPLTCAFRRHIRLSLVAYRLPLSFLMLGLCLVAYVRSRIRARRSDLARVPELVGTTLDRLATQAALHARGEAHEPFIPIGQLRDDVLRSELQGRRREDLWKRVRNVVEGNANVRAATRESRGGDFARVWEWIGGISSVSDREATAAGASVVPGSSRRDSGKLQQHLPGGSPDTHPSYYHHHQPQLSVSPGGVGSSRAWDEGRPIY